MAAISLTLNWKDGRFRCGCEDGLDGDESTKLFQAEPEAKSRAL